MGINHSNIKSFRYALEGIKTSFKKEPNLRIQFVVGIGALLLGVYLGLSNVEWAILSFTILYVITLELLNTVIETIVDLVSPEIKEGAKTAKDISAAIVLISSILAVIVGVILFLPKLFFLFR